MACIRLEHAQHFMYVCACLCDSHQLFFIINKFITMLSKFRLKPKWRIPNNKSHLQTYRHFSQILDGGLVLKMSRNHAMQVTEQSGEQLTQAHTKIVMWK